jgi:hypothetical protein
MRRLPKPAVDTALHDLFVGVKPFRKRKIKYGVEPSIDDVLAILALYDSYDHQGGQWSDALEPNMLSDALVDAVRHAFTKTYKGRVLEHLRKELLDPNQLCPICGINFCGALDHFPAKDTAGIFAIYARNLIPICSDCNHKKLDHVGTTPDEQFVHTYLSDIPDYNFMKADVLLDGPSLSFRFRPIGAVLPPDLEKQVYFQLDRLSLQERYAREINLYLSSQAPNWPYLFDTMGAAGVSEHLSRQCVYEARQHHNNDWRAVVCWALCGHDEFCDGGFYQVFPNL